MYNHFNPWENPEAWWQHLLMLLVAAILGYIIGYRSRQNEIASLEAELDSLDVDLDNCLKSKKTVSSMTATPAASAVVPIITTPPTPDDLKIVEGIGPKIEQLLNSKGIYTFKQLANTDSEIIHDYLVAAGPNYRIHDPGTWPRQAQLAAEGKWEELKQWQDTLKGGKIE